MEHSYKFRIYPSSSQINQININFNCSRYVYNYYLAKRNELWKKNHENFGFYACGVDLTKLKKQLEWLNDADSTCLRYSLLDLDMAFQNFIKGRATAIVIMKPPCLLYGYIILFFLHKIKAKIKPPVTEVL